MKFNVVMIVLFVIVETGLHSLGGWAWILGAIVGILVLASLVIYGIFALCGYIFGGWF